MTQQFQSLTPERLAALIRQYSRTLYFTQKHAVKADSCSNLRTNMSRPGLLITWFGFESAIDRINSRKKHLRERAGTGSKRGMRSNWEGVRDDKKGRNRVPFGAETGKLKDSWLRRRTRWSRRRTCGTWPEINHSSWRSHTPLPLRWRRRRGGLENEKSEWVGGRHCVGGLESKKVQGDWKEGEDELMKKNSYTFFFNEKVKKSNVNFLCQSIKHLRNKVNKSYISAVAH